MKRRLFALALALCMLVAVCAACNNNNKPVTSDPDSSAPQGSTTTTTDDGTTTTVVEDPTTEDDTTITDVITDPTTGIIDGIIDTDGFGDEEETTYAEGAWTTTSTTSTPIGQPEGEPKTLYVKDFGAKGDGVTDDGVAMVAAVAELRNSPKGSTLIFEKNKTYYVKNNGLKKVFYFDGNEGLTVKGDNTSIMVGGTKLTYLGISNCRDITIEGFNFDYADHKAAFAGKVLEINGSEGWVIIEADRDIKMETGEEAYPLQPDWFGIIPHKVSRYHMYLKKYEMLDAAQRKVKVYFDTSNGTTMYRLANEVDKLKEDGLVLPDPFTGNARGDLECGLGVEYVENFTMRNVNIYSVARHGFSLAYNTGEVLFENVNFMRAPYDQGLRYVSWADTYHLLHNRAKYTWINCKNEWNYDDVFNISSATMLVDDVYSTTDIRLRGHDGSIDDLQPGDEIQIINPRTGMWVVRTTIKSIISRKDGTIRVKLAEAMSTTRDYEGWYAWSETHGAPGAEFIDCEFDGTFRARTKLTMTNCTLQNRRFWIGLEALQWEGPCGSDIIFKNCEFIVENNFEISSFNSVKGGYRLENVVFDGCTGIGVSADSMLIGSQDEVIFK